MRGSDSHRPFTPGRSGLPSLPGARADQYTVVDGPLLFCLIPWSLDVSPCPRKTPTLRRLQRQVLPASSGEAFGIFNDISFGVYLTPRSLPCLRFAHGIAVMHARLGYCSHAIGLTGWHYTNSGYRQLSGHAPDKLTRGALSY